MAMKYTVMAEAMGMVEGHGREARGCRCAIMVRFGINWL